MSIRGVFLAGAMCLGLVSSMPGQTATPSPMLSAVEAPYRAIQNAVTIAGTSFPAGTAAYGPVNTPLVISGKDFGAEGAVEFISYHKSGTSEVAGTPVYGNVSSWSESIIFVTVPNGALTGLIKVVSAEGKTSNGLPFLVTPGVYANSCPAFPPKTQFAITTSGLPNGTANQAYSVTLGASGGSTPYSWSLASGTLPAGMILNEWTGVISGTPTTAAGPVSLGIEATDNTATAADAVLNLTIDSPTLTPTTVYSYSAGYDSVGNVTSYTDQIMGTWGFKYDDLNRLSSATPSTGVYAGQSQRLCLAYDSFGNRTQSDFQTTACSPSDAATATYSSNNQLHTASAGVFTSDNAGNITYDGVNYYTYDGESRVCAMQTTPYAGGTVAYGYLYDAGGRRVAKGTINTVPLGQYPSCNMATNGFTTTESYVLGQDDERLTTLAWSGGTSTWQSTNVYGAGQLLATYDANGLHFQLADPLGTRRVQTNSIGEAELDCQSLPFGDQLSCFPDPQAPNVDADADATGSLTSIHFTGKERDAESGLDYFGARYYASSMGRFLSPDWSANQEPVPYADLDDPQSLNLYSYVRNNPLSKLDPYGHQEATVPGVIGLGVALGQIIPTAMDAYARHLIVKADTELINTDYEILTKNPPQDPGQLQDEIQAARMDALRNAFTMGVALKDLFAFGAQREGLQIYDYSLKHIPLPDPVLKHRPQPAPSPQPNPAPAPNPSPQPNPGPQPDPTPQPTPPQPPPNPAPQPNPPPKTVDQ